MAKKKTGRTGMNAYTLILIRDIIYMTVGSLLSILTPRFMLAPIPSYINTVLIWVGVALVASLAAGKLSRFWKLDFRVFDSRLVGRLLLFIFIKESIFIVVLLSGLVRLPDLLYSSLALLFDTLISLFFLLLPRFINHSMYHEEQKRVKSVGRKRVLIAGTGKSSLALKKSAETIGRYCILGFVSSSRSMEGKEIDGCPVYCCSDVKDLYALQWHLSGIDNILFPMDWIHFDDSDDGKMAVEKKKSAEPVAVGGRKHTAYEVTKRMIDIVLSSILLVVFSPLMLICALLILAEDGGPVIYSQERIGKDAKTFRILKFRSMRVDAEGGVPSLCSGKSDPRLTRTGAFLRAHHLDELPQLWNVLRGDMSFIGYRPERAIFIDRIMDSNPRYQFLYQCRPGVTSYATLYNGYTDSIEKMLMRLELDLYYHRNQSIFLDMFILGKTFLKIVSGKKF